MQNLRRRRFHCEGGGGAVPNKEEVEKLRRVYGWMEGCQARAG